MDGIKNFKYKIIPNLLDEKEIFLLKEYCKNKHIGNQKNFDINQNNCGDTYFYKDELMEVILRLKKEIIEKEIGIDLNETYTFWRCYTYGAELTKHTDRPSCEISATVFIDSDDTEWPIFMGGKSVSLNKGDAVIYKGCDVEHWREPFNGDYHMQVFLHYVDKHGKYSDYKGDVKR